MRYFAYGMNLDPETMTGWGASDGVTCKPIGPARLYGWRLEFHGFAGIVEADPDEYVEGALWEINDEALEMLDYREGYPRMYDRVEVTVQEPHDESTATVYYPTGLGLYGLCPPGAYYLEMIQNGYRYFALPTAKLDEALQRATESYRREERV